MQSIKWIDPNLSPSRATVARLAPTVDRFDDDGREREKKKSDPGSRRCLALLGTLQVGEPASEVVSADWTWEGVFYCFASPGLVALVACRLRSCLFAGGDGVWITAKAWCTRTDERRRDRSLAFPVEPGVTVPA